MFPFFKPGSLQELGGEAQKLPGLCVAYSTLLLNGPYWTGPFETPFMNATIWMPLPPCPTV